MTRRVRIGDRNGVMGAFVSEAGYDVLTAGPMQLLLNISEKYSNLLKLGVVGGSGTVALGYGAQPFVLITGLGNFNEVPEVAWPSDVNGPSRPSPNWWSSQDAYAVINGGGTSMTITSPIKIYYSVYSRVFAS